VARGDTVVIVSRAMRAGPDGMEFVPGRTTSPGAWEEAIAGCDAVVHLAGEPIPSWRWSALHQRRVTESRVLGTRALARVIGETVARPRVLVAASAVDVYPFDDEETRYAEDAAAGEHPLAELCRAWEAEARAAAAHGLRVVTLRSGIVIGRGARSFKNLATPWKLFFRGPMGSGEQWFSWVHIDDVVTAYLWALDDAEIAGAVNLVAPGAIRQGDFARAVSAVLGRRVWEPIDEPRLRAHLGGFADYLLHGRRAVPLALERAGFRFRRADAPAALAASLEEVHEEVL
jgi:uncharacterized protein (TIGR01777 family)